MKIIKRLRRYLIEMNLYRKIEFYIIFSMNNPSLFQSTQYCTEDILIFSNILIMLGFVCSF